MGRLVWAFSPGAERTYYTLRPSFSDSSERVYVPVEKADASLKNVMTEKEAQTYLENFGKMQVKPTLTNKAPMLAAHYRELLSSCNVSDHLRLYKEIYEEIKINLIKYLEEFGEITLGQYRDMLNSSRKNCMIILENFDRNKITKRDDNKRTLYNK